MDISRLQENLHNLARGIEELKTENSRLRVAALANKGEVRKEYEAELDYLKDELSRSWMTLSPLEDECLRKFRDKHYQLHKRDNGFIAHIFGTGIGTCYRIECPICHESEDITDVSNW